MSGKACLLFITLPFVSLSAVYAAQDVIRVGADLANPPFQSKDKNGHPTGFDIDVTNALCRSINAKCDYVVNTFDAQIPSLLSRKTDIILPLGVTEKKNFHRFQSLCFSRSNKAGHQERSAFTSPGGYAQGEEYCSITGKYSGNICQ